MKSRALIFLLLSGLRVHAQEPVKLRIVVIEGEGVINDTKQRTNRPPVVEVQDENGKPVAGAAVAFSLPSQGPSGEFPNGSKSLTTTTDSQGRASALGIHPNHQTGTLEIRVTASYQGRTANAIITQTNVPGAAPVGMSAGKKVLIVAVVVGAAAAGGIAATRHGSSSSSSSPPALVITPGAPSVGGPH